MALTDIEKNLLFDYSQQMLQQDMLTNQIFAASKVGQDLRSLVLGEPVRAETFTNPFEEAISGKLRTDADTTRQAAKNVGEAAKMMQIAHSSMETINDALEDMEDILEKVKNGDLDGTDATVQSDFDSLRDKIIGLYEDTDFNGIFMLDSSRWGNDQIDANGNVFIQSSNNGGFNITFHAIDAGTSSYDWTDLQGSDLANGAGQTTQEGVLLDMSSYVSMVEDLYEGKVDSLESQQTALEGQAQILDQAAQLRKPSDSTYSLEKLLADLVTKEIGTLVDSSG